MRETNIGGSGGSPAIFFRQATNGSAESERTGRNYCILPATNLRLAAAVNGFKENQFAAGLACASILFSFSSPRRWHFDGLKGAVGESVPAAGDLPFRGPATAGYATGGDARVIPQRRCGLRFAALQHGIKNS
jgi:hypothetical protein